MTTINTLIFDLDGTLIDSSDGVVAAVNYSLEQMGEPTQSAERIKTYIGYPLSQMYPDFTNKPIEELHRHFQVKASETVVLSTIALPGVDKTLRQLQRLGFRMAIASTKIKAHIEGAVDLLGWNELFETTTGGDEVKRVKPDPMAFELACRKMSVNYSEVLVIGDTENDVLAAKAIPIEVVAVKSPYGDSKRLQAAKPDHLLEDIRELPELIKQINANRQGTDDVDHFHK